MAPTVSYQAVPPPVSGSAYASPSTSNYTSPLPPPSPVLSIVSLVCGIVGLLAVGWFGIASIAAITIGFIAAKREPQGRGLRLAGIITGFVGLAVTLVGATFLLFTAFAYGTGPYG